MLKKFQLLYLAVKVPQRAKAPPDIKTKRQQLTLLCKIILRNIFISYQPKTTKQTENLPRYQRDETNGKFTKVKSLHQKPKERKSCKTIVQGDSFICPLLKLE